MAVGITEEHAALAASVRRWAADRCPPAVPRAYLDTDDEPLPVFWPDLAAQGWLGLHVAEEHGGAGFGAPELAVVLEELGRACAPGPFLPTVLVAALIAEAGSDALRAELLPRLASGELTAAAALDAAPTGSVARPLLGPAYADLVLVAHAPDPTVSGYRSGGPVSTHGLAGEAWSVLDAPPLTQLPSVDATRRISSVALASGAVPPDRVLIGLTTERVREVAATLIAAEAAGIAGWCLDTAVAYAKVREQFGRPIGQFQAVKHRCADMAIAVEQARAAAWDAARALDDPDQAPLAAAVAAVVAPEAALRVAKDCVQVLGGIGFTWEHDVHLYLKRAIALRQLLGGPSGWRQRTAGLAVAGRRRNLDVDLPASADEYREQIRAFVSSLEGLDAAARRERLVDEGYLVPHYPRPWGREAGAVEQLVIDEEFRRAKVRRPHLQVGAWVVPTLIAYATPEQQERWLGPTLRGEVAWCQMFSEPGAGSDLASLATKATRVEGGWLLTGQKVWTSMAHAADFAICLARTDPDAPKHDGITYFVVDMKSEGIDVRPLRELTGHAMFNEVFLSDVFVPDDNVVGAVNDGWRGARNTLANERVAMSTGSSFGGGVETLVLAVVDTAMADDPVVLDAVGAMVAEGQSVSLLATRDALRALSGAEPGPGSSLRKLLGVEHDQRASELGLTLLGPEGATTDGAAAAWVNSFLANRCLTIAGGTSEVQRNVIAERLLGLPRDPSP